MPISKGEAWGGPGPLPPDTPVAASDREAARLFEAGAHLVALAGGDLCRTLGGRGDVAARRGASATICPVDVGVVRSDDEESERHFVAHVVARGIGWHGCSAVVMNAEWLGELRLGPRSHPGDGVLDVTTGALALRERLVARRRARTGDHLPHPRLQTRRVREHRIDFDRPRAVHVDGERWRRARAITVRVVPAALHVAV